MEFKFDTAKWQINASGTWLWLKAPDSMKKQIQEFILGLSDKQYICTIKQHRNKRSLNANSYAWLLINEVANVLRLSKEEVYLQMLKRYGQSSVVSVVESAAETFKKSVKYCEDFGEAELNGKKFIHIKVYAGSSTYDSKEMSILIDGIVSEAKELGIETMTPAEIEKLKGAWGQ
jgi:hypothetical protein